MHIPEKKQSLTFSVYMKVAKNGKLRFSVETPMIFISSSPITLMLGIGDVEMHPPPFICQSASLSLCGPSLTVMWVYIQ